jgi:hypothetical protein
MHITTPTHLLTGSAHQLSFKAPPLKDRFQLTQSDRVGIERLLSLGLTAQCPYPALIEGFLRHKLRLSRPAPDPTPTNLVVAGRHVSYMITGGNARSGIVTFVPSKDVRSIPVTTFLGATMLGMHKRQRMSVLREDGGIDTLVVLDISGA